MTKRILIANDDRATLTKLEYIVEKFFNDCEIILAESGQEAFNKTKELGGQFYLALIDHYMPAQPEDKITNGAELIEAIREEGYKFKIISTSTSETGRRMGVKAGADYSRSANETRESFYNLLNEVIIEDEFFTA